MEMAEGTEELLPPLSLPTLPSVLSFISKHPYRQFRARSLPLSPKQQMSLEAGTFGLLITAGVNSQTLILTPTSSHLQTVALVDPSLI